MAINEIVMRERGVDLHKEVAIPAKITPPYEMVPPTWFKPSLPTEFPHPYTEYGVKMVEGVPVAWFQTPTWEHRFETEFHITVNGEKIWRRTYFFKD